MTVTDLRDLASLKIRRSDDAAYSSSNFQHRNFPFLFRPS